MHSVIYAEKFMATGMFTDKVKITIKAGDGGDGMNSFKAFKGKPACGPDGGDGGKGGDIYFVGDKDMTDLFRSVSNRNSRRATANAAARTVAAARAARTWKSRCRSARW